MDSDKSRPISWGYLPWSTWVDIGRWTHKNINRGRGASSEGKGREVCVQWVLYSICYKQAAGFILDVTFSGKTSLKPTPHSDRSSHYMHLKNHLHLPASPLFSMLGAQLLNLWEQSLLQNPYSCKLILQLSKEFFFKYHEKIKICFISSICSY